MAVMAHLEDVGVADRQARLRLLGMSPGEVGQLRLVARQSGTLEVERRDLSLQLPHSPVAPDALDLVEGAFDRVFDRQQLHEMRERQLADQLGGGDGGLWTRRLPDRGLCGRST